MLDNETIANQQDLLAAYRQTLAILVRTAARHGGESFAPPATANGIIEARANIARIKTELHALGVAVADEPNDIAPPPPDPSQGAGHIAKQRTVDTGGGDYAERDIDKRQGTFVKDSRVTAPIIGENKGTIYINPTANTELTQDQKEEAEIQKYIDFITEQVSSGRLHEKASPNIRNIASSHTRILLKSINKERKGRIVTFLYDARLIGWYEIDQTKVHPHIISLEKATLRDADLAGADLRDADLAGADLRDADLAGADLRDADLAGADLRDANLAEADLTGAILYGANIAGANIYGAILYGANIAGADLRDANLDGANIDGADLTEANIDGADLTGASLNEANLRQVTLSGANLRQAMLNNADLSGGDLRRANLYGASLNEASLNEASLTGASLSRAFLYGADLTGAILNDANLTGAILNDANLTGADLTGADLRGASLTAANFRGTRWDNDTQWPDRFTPPANAIKTKSPGTL
jgi:uncharacterized protein YjbI with pentapeptide repeats